MYALDAVSTQRLPSLALAIILLHGGFFRQHEVLLRVRRVHLVHDLGLLTNVQLMDAVAVGQFTPGPVLSTATFIGYLIAGPAGAVVATVGIFLPSFVFVAAVNPVIAKLRSSRLMAAFLDAANVSAVGLMGAMLVRVAESALVDEFSWWMAGAGLLVMLSQRVSPGWLIIAGAITGYATGM